MFVSFRKIESIHRSETSSKWRIYSCTVCASYLGGLPAWHPPFAVAGNGHINFERFSFWPIAMSSSEIDLLLRSIVPFWAELINIIRKCVCTNKQITFLPLGICILNTRFRYSHFGSISSFLTLFASVFLFVFISLSRSTTIHYVVIVCQIFDLATWQSNFRKVFVPSSQIISNHLMFVMVWLNININMLLWFHHTNLWSAFSHYRNQTLIETVFVITLESDRKSKWNVEKFLWQRSEFSPNVHMTDECSVIIVCVQLLSVACATSM